MYKDRKKSNKAAQERMRRYRERKGVTATEVQGVTNTDYPDIIDKLTDEKWRGKLEGICASFNTSPAKRYKKDVWLGVPNQMFTIGGSGHKSYNLVEVCGLLEATSV